MDVCLGKSNVLNRKPVAYLTCNGSPPVDNKPSLMTFRDVETLFHEFGHGLQHMLTTVRTSHNQLYKITRDNRFHIRKLQGLTMLSGMQ